MRLFDGSAIGLMVLLACWALLFTDATQASSLRALQIRTDLIRLYPFQVQIAIQDETTAGDSETVSDTLYGGSLLTDTITDWMMASFVKKTSNEQAEQILVNNYTTFDSIALELVDESTNLGIIEGQELSLVQVSYEGVSLWEREGTGTPPMGSDIVELIQRATFLEDRTLKASLQTTVNNLLFDLNINSVDGVQPITIHQVRAYITPPGSTTGGEEGNGSGQDGNGSSGGSGSASQSNSNQNLEIIIIVAIVVACMAFGLLIFAILWAWRSDRQDRSEKRSSSSRKTKKTKKTKSVKTPSEPSENGGNGTGTSNTTNNNKTTLWQKRTSKGQGNAYQQAPEEAEAPSEPASSYDLPNNQSDGSYPKVIGNTRSNGAEADYPEDSVISEDISSSLTAYYKSGMGYAGAGGSKTSSGRPSNPSQNFNDAASISSMDSYGYSLDGYAPSLGPAQGGYPVGPMQAARDAAMPVGDEAIDLQRLQDEESVDDYDSEPIKTPAVEEA